MAYTKGTTAFNGLESWLDDTGQPRILFITDTYDEELRDFWCDEWPELYDWLVTNEAICPALGISGSVALIVRLG
jgi:hypothetical protein